MAGASSGGLLTVADVADLIGVPRSTLEQWRRLRIGPPAVRVGSVSMWRHRSVTGWIADGGGLEYGISLTGLRDDVGDDLGIPGGVGGPAQAIPA